MNDDIEKSLRALSSEPLNARVYAGRDERVALIKAVGGPFTAANIRKARGSYAVERIPFLFNSLAAELVIDILANDLDSLIEEMIRDKKSKAK